MYYHSLVFVFSPVEYLEVRIRQPVFLRGWFVGTVINLGGSWGHPVVFSICLV